MDDAPSPEPVVGERRLPMALAVLALMALAIVSPVGLALLPGWLLAAVEGTLLVALILTDPGRIDRETRWTRAISFALVTVIIVSTLTATVLLLVGLLQGSEVTQDPVKVLVAGAKVWLGNNVAFALALLADRLRWAGRPGPRDAAASGLRLPAATEPGAGPAGLAAGVHRLPVHRVHERERVQPHRHDADDPLGEGGDGLSGAHLVRDHRPRHRAGGQPVRLSSGAAPGPGSRRRPPDRGPDEHGGCRRLGPEPQPPVPRDARPAPNGHLVCPAAVVPHAYPVP